MTQRLVATVSGRVQGVGFRYWTAERATDLGLAGSATNLPDGRVEVIAEGQKVSLDALVDALRSVDTPGYVDAVEVDWQAPEGLDRFVTR